MNGSADFTHKENSFEHSNFDQVAPQRINTSEPTERSFLGESVCNENTQKGTNRCVRHLDILADCTDKNSKMPGNTLKETNGVDETDWYTSVMVLQALEILPPEEISDKFYSMKSDNKGHALVIVNSFEGCSTSKGDSVDELGGGEKNFRELIRLFMGLGYMVHASMNQTAEQMRRRVNKLREMEDHSSMDSCVVAIRTHGDEEWLMGNDQERYSRKELIEAFNNENCPSLTGKPKLFFLDACYGGKELDWTDVPGAKPEGTCADMCFFTASKPEYISYANKRYGGIFTKALLEIFAANAHNTRLSEMFTKIQDAVRKQKIPCRDEENEGKIQVFRQEPDNEEDYSLTKDLYFNPKKRTTRCPDVPWNSKKQCNHV